MGFYEELSRYYDEIFPVEARDMRFMAGLMQGRKRLLDLGCGTGNKSVFFVEPGTELIGIDSDSGMIARARAENAPKGVRYEVLDMMDADKRFAPSSFDGALCLGNTLVHLDGVGQIASFLHKTAALLTRGGRLLLQTLNYDRILDAGVSALPLLESPNVIFRREYARQGEMLRFATSIELKTTGEAFHNDIPLYPLRRKELERCLSEAGFGAPSLYGGFDGRTFEADSFVVIAQCDKE